MVSDEYNNDIKCLAAKGDGKFNSSSSASDATDDVGYRWMSSQKS